MQQHPVVGHAEKTSSCHHQGLQGLTRRPRYAPTCTLLPYICPTTMHVLLYMCPHRPCSCHPAIYASRTYTTTSVRTYYYISVLLLCMSYFICVLIGPAIYALRTYTTTSVCTYDYICVLIGITIGPSMSVSSYEDTYIVGPMRTHMY